LIAEELAAQRAGSEIDKVTKIGRRDSAKAAIEGAGGSVAALEVPPTVKKLASKKKPDAGAKA